jgi:hypothetical protein
MRSDTLRGHPEPEDPGIAELDSRWPVWVQLELLPRPGARDDVGHSAHLFVSVEVPVLGQRFYGDGVHGTYKTARATLVTSMDLSGCLIVNQSLTWLDAAQRTERHRPTATTMLWPELLQDPPEWSALLEPMQEPTPSDPRRSRRR